MGAVDRGRPQNDRRERRLIHGIGIVLRLEAEAGTLPVHHPALAGDGAVEEVPRVKLNAGFGGPDFHLAARFGIKSAGREPELAGVAIQHKIVIVASGVSRHFRDVRADSGRLGEVEGRSLHGQDLAGWNQRGVHRSVLGGVEFENLGENVLLAAEIEIAVIGHIDRGRFVGLGRVFNLQFVAVGQAVDDRDLEVAGEAFVAIGAVIAEADRRAVFFMKRFGLPRHMAQILRPAVQAVWRIVDLQGILFPVERELGFRDAVRHSANRRSEPRGLTEVALDLVEAEYHIAELSGPVRDPQFGQGRAIGNDLRDGAFRILQCVLLDRGTVRHAAKLRRFHSSLRS